jgi:hypothetical protein
VGCLADIEHEQSAADGLNQTQDEGGAVDFAVKFDTGTGVDEHNEESPENGGDEVAVEIAGYPTDKGARNNNPGNSDQEQDGNTRHDNLPESIKIGQVIVS